MAHLPSLTLYRRIAQLGWPRSYVGKLFLIAFVATHIPLLSIIIAVLVYPAKPLALTPLLALLTLATLFGTTLLLWGAHQLLAPMLLASEALRRYCDEAVLPELQVHFQDEAEQPCRGSNGRSDAVVHVVRCVYDLGARLDAWQRVSRAAIRARSKSTAYCFRSAAAGRKQWLFVIQRRLCKHTTTH